MTLLSQVGWALTPVWIKISYFRWKYSRLNIWAGLRFSSTKWRRSAKCRSGRWRSRAMLRKNSSRLVESTKVWSHIMDCLLFALWGYRMITSMKLYVGLRWATTKERGSGYRKMASFICYQGLWTSKRSSSLKKENRNERRSCGNRPSFILLWIGSW